MKISFEAATLPELAKQVVEAARYFDSNGVTVPIEEITEKAEKVLNEIAEEKEAQEKPKRARKAKTEKPAKVEETFNFDDLDAQPETPAAVDVLDDVGEVDEKAELSLEDDVIPAFRAYVKKKTVKEGSEKAMSLVRNILAKFEIKNVKDLQPKDFARAMEFVA